MCRCPGIDGPGHRPGGIRRGTLGQRIPDSRSPQGPQRPDTERIRRPHLYCSILTISCRWGAPLSAELSVGAGDIDVTWFRPVGGAPWKARATMPCLLHGHGGGRLGVAESWASVPSTATLPISGVAGVAGVTAQCYIAFAARGTRFTAATFGGCCRFHVQFTGSGAHVRTVPSQ